MSHHAGDVMEYTHTIDVALMRKMLEHVTAHPEQHNQGTWGYIADSTAVERYQHITHCGTTACAAGWTCVLADSTGVSAPSPLTGLASLVAVDDNGEPVEVWSRARKLLGLSRTEAEQMFLCAQDSDDLWRLANEFTQGEIEIPPHLSDAV